jgi:hypothetical protein
VTVLPEFEKLAVKQELIADKLPNNSVGISLFSILEDKDYKRNSQLDNQR